MKIERVELIFVRMPLVSPFESSNTRVSELDKLLLKVYTPEWSVYSECTADARPFYSYETVGTAALILKEVLLPEILGKNLEGPATYVKMTGRLRGHPMAKAAVENALWVLSALEQRKPLAVLLGGEKQSVASGVSVGIQDSAEDLVRAIAAYLEEGYRRVKIKIKPGKDLSVVQAVRKTYPFLPLMVDANGAYRLSESALFEGMDGSDLMMIEQPLAHDDIVDHAKLQARVKTPLCLDESIQSPYFARVAAELGACRIINVKQGRVGGLSAAKEVHDVARANNMGVWCGGMLETGIGRAVNVALASLPNFVYPNDISASKRYWERDIIDPPFSLNPEGTIDVPSAAGLGVTVDEKALARVTLAREVIRL